MTKRPEDSTSPARIAYTISEFCDLAGISRSFWYNLPAAERPAARRVAGRVLITADSARAWLANAGVAA
jgi:hypothetical protein